MTSSASTKPFHSHATFADFLASDPELLVFRRFDLLNARALLYLQSELMTLEVQLLELDKEDMNDGSMDVMLAARCFEVLTSRAAQDFPREAERIELIRRIQDVSYRYNKMLVVQSQVQQIAAPKTRVWNVFTNWFRQAKPFVGHSRHLLRKKTKEDFVAIGAVGDHDVLTRVVEYLTGRIVAWKRSSSNSQEAPMYYKHQTVARIITLISIIGATLLLEAAIVGLYVVTNDHVRFVLIAVFIALFAVALSLFSNARRAEMFGATAAYAAVLVVFVSGNLSSGGTKS
ncbi:hypothetical protein P153DRAFT_391077 [Dothidotthia symphoricarpi CBS 119687]|uniref:DUF6594 domain-containing protein n=1 Tax=Dothidotthia symphoricarpi CBS 119687 TaxID=1392245 RepID=A0A6A5ZYR8_9PLEO|nr:uncharacterized protein P153DRAFT_391077 [Dothidotthia symphoricarpi CBS 119687]KAF2124044.1 hypothetical protein P153DRAFT_391077 [Dothidotthia symphoricarpi CBS 119687]